MPVSRWARALLAGVAVATIGSTMYGCSGYSDSEAVERCQAEQQAKASEFDDQSYSSCLSCSGRLRRQLRRRGHGARAVQLPQLTLGAATGSQTPTSLRLGHGPGAEAGRQPRRMLRRIASGMTRARRARRWVVLGALGAGSAAACGAACTPETRDFNPATSASSSESTGSHPTSTGTHPGSGGNGAGGDGAGGANGSFTIALDHADVLVTPGDESFVVVTVNRESAQFIDVSLSATDLPPGVTVADVDVPGDMTTGTLVVKAAATAAQGGTFPVTVKATSNGVTKTAKLGVAISGAPGTADLNFGTMGTFATTIGPGATAGRGLCLQADGKIVVTGANGLGQAATLRLTTDGKRDMAFGTNGVVSTLVESIAGGLVVAQEHIGGHLVVGGYAGASATQTSLLLLSYDGAGVLDTTFGTMGSAEDNAGTGNGEVHAVLPTPTGPILSAGELFGATGSLGALAYRHTAQGGGETNILSFDAVAFEAAALDASGKIVIVGGDGSDFWIGRFSANGARDTTFGGTSIVNVDFSMRLDTAYGVVISSSGKILVGGVSDAAAAPDPRVALVQLNDDGTLDTSFGNMGKALTMVPLETSALGAIAVDSKGRVLFGGFVTQGGVPTLAVARASRRPARSTRRSARWAPRRSICRASAPAAAVPASTASPSTTSIASSCRARQAIPRRRRWSSRASGPDLDGAASGPVPLVASLRHSPQSDRPGALGSKSNSRVGRGARGAAGGGGAASTGASLTPRGTSHARTVEPSAARAAAPASSGRAAVHTSTRCTSASRSPSTSLGASTCAATTTSRAGAAASIGLA